MSRARIIRAVLLVAFSIAATGPVRPRQARAQNGTAAPAVTVAGVGVPCAGRTVDEVVLEGCAATRCAEEKARADLLALAGVATGVPYAEEQAQRAVERLEQTRFFHTVTTHCEDRGGRTALVLTVAGTWTVWDVEIDGNQFFYDSDIRKRVFLRPGTVLDPRPEQLDRDRERQEESIRRLYAREGFARAQVHVTIPELEGGGSETLPGRATVHIQVDEGPKDRVGDVEVLIERDPDVPTRVGCPKVTAADVRSASDVGRGDMFTPLVARQGRKRVLAMLRLRGYVSPDVDLPHYDIPTQRLTFRIALGRCYDLALYRRSAAGGAADGWQRTWDDQLAETLPFAESGAFDEEEAEYGRQELERLYEARGHLFADVRLDYRDYRVDHEESGAPPDVQGAIHYYVSEDEALEIRDVYLDGVAAFPEETVRGWMETEAYDFFGEGGYLQVQRLLWDLAAVRERYRDAGYLRFGFRGCEEIEEDSAPAWTRAARSVTDESEAEAPDEAADDDRIRRRVWQSGRDTVAGYAVGDTCFRVVRTADEASVYVHVFVDEGPLSRVGDVLLRGNQRLSDEEAREALRVKPGDPFSPRRVTEAVQRLRRAYHGKGIYPVEVEVACEGRDPLVPPEFCRLDQIVAAEVALRLDVREGTPRVVGQRFVRGNFRTADSIVLRDLPAPGEPYDEERILDGVRKLRDLGVFESLKVTPMGLDEEPPRKEIALVVDVEESDAKFLDLAVGFETLNRDEQSMPTFLTQTLSDGLGAADQRTGGYGASPLVRLPDLLIVFEASYVHRNFLGWAKELHIPLKYGLSTTEVNRLASFKPTYLDSRFLGYELLFRLTPFIVYDRATQALDEFEYGFQTEFSKQLTQALYASLEYELSRIQVRNPREQGSTFGPFTLQNKLSPRLSYDRTDHPLHPTRGWYLGASLSYINALQEERFENFLKWELSAKAYVSLRATVILAFFLHYGGSYSFEDTDLPLDERYRLLLRGYAQDTIGQYDAGGRLKLTESTNEAGETVFSPLAPGGDQILNGTAEVRFPIIRRLDLWLAVFLDWGALEEDLRDLTPKSLRFSAGFGIRWLVGGQIPIRIDYGIVIDPRCKAYTQSAGTEITDRDQLECVSEDFGTLHFGLLYTF